MWIGLLHHVTGEHSWALGSCHHGPLTEIRDKDWIESNSTAHQKLTELILDAQWLKDIPKYLHFRCVSTWFHQLFCSTLLFCTTISYIVFTLSIFYSRWVVSQPYIDVHQQTLQLYAPCVQCTHLACSTRLLPPHQQIPQKNSWWQNSVIRCIAMC